MRLPSVSLVIPCYNERDRVERMMTSLFAFMNKWEGDKEIIVVDDGSTDGSIDAVKAHPAFNPDHFRFIAQQNIGKGGALKKGVLQSKGEYVLTLDADMATSPLELLNWMNLHNIFSSTDICIGSREVNKQTVNDKWYREWIGHAFNFIIRTITGLQLKDTQCGFKWYERTIAQALFTNLETNGWAHDVEILLRAKKLGYIIHEMPVQWEAVAGSKINIVQDSWNMFWEVIRIRNKSKRW